MKPGVTKYYRQIAISTCMCTLPATDNVHMIMESAPSLSVQCSEWIPIIWCITYLICLSIDNIINVDIYFPRYKKLDNEHSLGITQFVETCWLCGNVCLL